MAGMAGMAEDAVTALNIETRVPCFTIYSSCCHSWMGGHSPAGRILTPRGSNGLLPRESTPPVYRNCLVYASCSCEDSLPGGLVAVLRAFCSVGGLVLTTSMATRGFSDQSDGAARRRRLICARCAVAGRRCALTCAQCAVVGRRCALMCAHGEAVCAHGKVVCAHGKAVCAHCALVCAHGTFNLHHHLVGFWSLVTGPTAQTRKKTGADIPLCEPKDNDCTVFFAFYECSA